MAQWKRMQKEQGTGFPKKLPLPVETWLLGASSCWTSLDVLYQKVPLATRTHCVTSEYKFPAKKLPACFFQAKPANSEPFKESRGISLAFDTKHKLLERIFSINSSPYNVNPPPISSRFSDDLAAKRREQKEIISCSWIAMLV